MRHPRSRRAEIQPALAAQYIAGADLPWHEIHDERRPPAPLPTTVFEREEFWQEAASDAAHLEVARDLQVTWEPIELAAAPLPDAISIDDPGLADDLSRAGVITCRTDKVRWSSGMILA